MALSPSQRIQLIREIGSRMSAEDYELIDVTLKQFSLPRSDQWGGSKEAYVLRMIEGADDATLAELGQHVGFNLQDTSQRVDPPFWRKGMFRVFLSHLAAHKVTAAKLQEACLGFGMSCFVAHSDIEPTQEWQTQIETALATSDALVALLHPEFHASNWTDQEIGYAMGRGIPVYSVRLGQDPYGFIGKFQAFTEKGTDLTALARELFESFRKNKQTQARIGDVLVSLFEESGSYAEAKTRIGHLEELTTWDPSFTNRIRAALKANSQIYDSWNVPDRVKALTKKWANT